MPSLSATKLRSDLTTSMALVSTKRMLTPSDTSLFPANVTLACPLQKARPGRDCDASSQFWPPG